MLCFRFTSLLLLALTALTLVSCAVVDPPPIEFVTTPQGRGVADAEVINTYANFFERRLSLPQNYLSPASAYYRDLNYHTFRRILDHDQTRFNEVARSEAGAYYAVPFYGLRNGQRQRMITFLHIADDGRVTPTIHLPAKAENVPGSSHDLWSILQANAGRTRSVVERSHGRLVF
ncbi:uncharacterized protein UBRO_20003 [Ustilago bromivora]|uniref:Uncharacterized protein n=1 Tax=Ustilago bromivora TaxID=307758 RepID=A0A1K0GBX8_9BASI|nr:uncharacterized protein UBRO_20003 [Ustilago bromivora]